MQQKHFIDNSDQLNMFWAIISPIFTSARLCLQHYTTSFKHSVALLRMGKIIAWNMLS